MLDNYPRQSGRVGQRVIVAFPQKPWELVEGEVVRDDTEMPYVGIIKLADGRYALMSECQFDEAGGEK